jgi:hypothetical protein
VVRPRSRPRRDKPFGWKSIVGSYKPIYSDIPSCVFNVRALASVGKTEAKAKAESRAEKTYTNVMLDWLAAKTFGEAAAWAKVLVDEGADQVRGRTSWDIPVTNRYTYSRLRWHTKSQPERFAKRCSHFQPFREISRTCSRLY